jgi:hypothetical protein
VVRESAPPLRPDQTGGEVGRRLAVAPETRPAFQAVTGPLSRKMLEHYSHQRLKAKGQMLERMEVRRKGTAWRSVQMHTP